MKWYVLTTDDGAQYPGSAANPLEALQRMSGALNQLLSFEQIQGATDRYLLEEVQDEVVVWSARVFVRLKPHTPTFSIE